MPPARLTHPAVCRHKTRAPTAVKAFEADYGAKWPKAVAKITEHVDALLAFYDYPAEHGST